MGSHAKESNNNCKNNNKTVIKLNIFRIKQKAWKYRGNGLSANFA